MAPTESLLVPRSVELDRGRLRWDATDGYNPKRLTQEMAEGILRGFMRIKEASDLEILQYAKKYGVLGVWNRPRHNRGTERLQKWRWLSARYQALLKIAADLDSGRLPNERDYLDMIEAENGRAKVNRTFIDHVLRNTINDWVITGGLVLQLDLKNQVTVAIQPGKHRGPNLFGMLTLQLMLARCGNLYRCSCCGFPYKPPGRKPNRSQNNYCPECGGHKAAWRAASERYRENKRQTAGR
ncbi:MAG: hypothetical protein ACR2NN_29075 [Bryobacteraceae bacterium]